MGPPTGVDGRAADAYAFTFDHCGASMGPPTGVDGRRQISLRELSESRSFNGAADRSRRKGFDGLQRRPSSDPPGGAFGSHGAGRSCDRRGAIVSHATVEA